MLSRVEKLACFCSHEDRFQLCREMTIMSEQRGRWGKAQADDGGGSETSSTVCHFPQWPCYSQFPLSL